MLVEWSVCAIGCRDFIDNTLFSCTLKVQVVGGVGTPLLLPLFEVRLGFFYFCDLSQEGLPPFVIGLAGSTESDLAVCESCP
jgi:hypothetical protein